MAKVQGICYVSNCTNKQAFYKSNNGTRYYRKKCSKHHDEQYGMTINKKFLRKQWKESYHNDFLEINTNICSICGWDKASCDIHRINPGKLGGKYQKDNVIVLCPNCHRLVHRNIIVL